MSLLDQTGTVDESGTFATAIYDALNAAMAAAGEAEDADPDVANRKLADDLAAAIYAFLIEADVTTTVATEVETVTATTPIVVAGGTGTGSGTGEGIGEGDPDAETGGLT